MCEISDKDRSRVNDLTIDEVRACPIFAHFTDEQAAEVISTIRQFCIIVYDEYQKNNQKIL